MEGSSFVKYTQIFIALFASAGFFVDEVFSDHYERRMQPVGVLHLQIRN